MVGLVGLYQPKIFEKPLRKPTEVVPVLFTPPAEPPQREDVPPDQPADQPVVVTIVAPANAKVAFSIPVQGAVAIANEVRFATPPPRSQKVSGPQPTAFNYRAAGAGGRFPDPSYPRSEMMQRHQGKITLYIVVDASGVPPPKPRGTANPTSSTSAWIRWATSTCYGPQCRRRKCRFSAELSS
jgi:outer membrane biosynthesis protein TonB